MPRRSTTLNNFSASAITREIGSKYDVIKEVSEYLDDIETLVDADIPGLIAALEAALDFTGITVVTVPEGTPASWDAVTATLYVPTVKGDDGRGVVSVSRTSGDGSAGTVDEYTIEYTDGSSTVYSVQNGRDGIDGTSGVPGKDGLTPIVSFTYDSVTGNLEYEIVGYEDLGVEPTDEEW